MTDRWVRLAGVSLIALLLIKCNNDTPPPEPLYPLPSEAQLAWHEMEMNAFIHFTINTFTDLEWGMGSESPALFNPTEANPAQWVDVLKKAGFKGVILTCKHHDGFCLWPSQYTNHSVKFSPYKNGNGDLVKELSDACKKQGLKFGIYLSPWDRNHKSYGQPEYITYYRNQLKELFTTYGPVFEMWFDGANGGTGYYGGTNERRNIDGKNYYDWPGTLEMIRAMEPDVIFFSDAGPGVRWVGNERGIAGETNWATISPDTLYAGKPEINDLLNEGSEDGTQWIPSETDVSIRPGWFYHASEDTLVKTAEQLFDIYLKSVGRGSLLLLNIPPDRRGLLHERDVQSLMEFRALLDRELKNNLAAGAKATSGSHRSNSKLFGPLNVTDGNDSTYWTTDDDVKSEYIEIDMGSEKMIKYIVIKEHIRLGQRVKSFTVEAMDNGHWQPIAKGTTIGYKKILKTDPVTVSKIRITINDSKACPVISSVDIY